MIKYLVREAVPSHYNVVRADDLPRPGVITSQVFELLDSAELVVADLSLANANVYYELAIRHVTRKPVIQLLADDESLPFDVAPIRTIPFNIHDLDSVDRAKKDLAAQVEYLEGSPEVDTPVSAAIQLRIAEASDEPIAKLVIEMSKTLTQLSDEVRQLKAADQWRTIARGTAFPPEAFWHVPGEVLYSDYTTGRTGGVSPGIQSLAARLVSKDAIVAEAQRRAMGEAGQAGRGEDEPG